MAERRPAPLDPERDRDEVIRLQERIRELRRQLDRIDGVIAPGDRDG